MLKLSTRRIHNLEDTCSAKSAQLRRGAANLARIGNHNGATYMVGRATRYERVAAKCRARLGRKP